MKNNNATNLSLSPLGLFKNLKSTSEFLLQTNEQPGDLERIELGHSHRGTHLISVSLLL